jgi:hypothetical protein
VLRHLAVPLAAAAACAIAGCGTDTVTTKAPVILNTKAVEHAIEASILTQRKLTADVDCPSGVHQQKGLTFRCIATTTGAKATFVVRQTDDQGHVTYDSK